MTLRWDPARGIRYLDAPDPEVEAKMDAAWERAPGMDRAWLNVRKDAPLRPGVAGMASFARSMVSGRNAPPEVVARRRLSCFGDPASGVDPCQRLVVDSGGKWCGACSCGRKKLAELSDPNGKLTFTYLECPLRRPGFSNSP